MEIFSPMTT